MTDWVDDSMSPCRNGPPPPNKPDTPVNSPLRLSSSAAAAALFTPDEMSTTTTTIALPPPPTLERPDFGSFARAQERISQLGITNSEAHGEMYKERVRGCLLKRGFRFWRAYVPRWVVLSGRMLRYFSQPCGGDDISHERGSIELTSDTVVSFEGIDLNPNTAATTTTTTEPTYFGFVVLVRGPLPQSKKPIAFYESDIQTQWCFRARTEKERAMWMRAIEHVVQLISRTELPSTLIGTGRIAEHFEFQRELGRGKYGLVQQARARWNNKQFAIRIVQKTKILSSHSQHMNVKQYDANWEREYRILRKLHSNHFSHRNLVYLYFVFEEPFSLFFVKDLLLHGNLEQRLAETEESQLDTFASSIVYQLSSALQAMHDMHIVLLDLQPHKLLFSNWKSIKINDFSNAHSLGNAEMVTMTESLFVMKPGYSSPELLTHKQVSKHCDMWSLGILLLYMLTRKEGYIRHEDVKRGKPPLHLDLLANKQQTQALDLIQKLTEINRTKRLGSVSHVLTHSFVKRKASLFRFTTVARTIVFFTGLFLRSKVPIVGMQVVVVVAPPTTTTLQLPKRKSQTMLRNEQWTMDGVARRSREDKQQQSLSGRSTANSSMVGFTGMGISSTHYGQDCEDGQLKPAVYQPGAFMSQLEQYLEIEALGFEDSEEEEEEEGKSSLDSPMQQQA